MRIKLNWGTGIFVFIILFFLTMTFLFIKANSIDVDLVERDYYPQGLRYQDEIDGKVNLNAIGEEPVITNSDDGLTVKLPAYFEGKDIQGRIQLYRPSDAALDIRDTLSSLQWSVSSAHLQPGQYFVVIEWHSAGIPYQWEGSVFNK